VTPEFHQDTLPRTSYPHPQSCLCALHQSLLSLCSSLPSLVRRPILSPSLTSKWLSNPSSSLIDPRPDADLEPYVSYSRSQLSHRGSLISDCSQPTLVQNGNILSTGGPFTANGEFNSFIAYLQTGMPSQSTLYSPSLNSISGGCGLNGEGCTLVEGTLQNTGFSSADVSLVPP